MSDPERVSGPRLPLTQIAPFVGRYATMMEYHPDRDPEQQDGVTGYLVGVAVYESDPNKLLAWFETIGKVTFNHASNISVEVAR